MATEKVRQLDPDAGKSTLEKVFPALEWIRAYRPSTAARDALAGLIVAVLLFPQAMAYALLADLPPQVGLYAAVLPAAAYALFGSSRFLAVGPVALVSLLTGEVIAKTSAQGLDPLQVALALAALVGAMLIVGGLLGAGVAADFLGRPVLDGFAAGAAVLIASSQLRHFFGLDLERASSFGEGISRLIVALPKTHVPTIVLGFTCLAMILAANHLLDPWLRRRGLDDAKRRPIVRSVPLIAIVGASVATAVMGLGAIGVTTVGAVAIGMPPFGVVDVGAMPWLSLLPSAGVIALIVFVVGFAVGRSLEADGEQVTADREMLGLGAANFIASFSGGYPVGASVSRSAVSRDVGSRTPLGPVFAGVIALTAGWLAGDFLVYLPKAALAALIIIAALGLIDLRAMWRTWRYDRGDGLVLIMTFLAVVFLGVDFGLGVGAMAGLLLYLIRTSRPRVVVEGQRGDSEHFASDEHEHVDELKKVPVMVMRVDADLFFGNARHVRERIIDEVTDAPELRCLLLDMEAVAAIDRTAYVMLDQLRRELEAAGVAMAMAEVKAPLREQLEDNGFFDEIGEQCVFVHVLEGVEKLEERCLRLEEAEVGTLTGEVRTLRGSEKP